MSAELIRRLRVKGASCPGPNVHDDAADHILALGAALTEMAGIYYYHKRLLDACNAILRRVGLPDFVRPLPAGLARRPLMLACQHDLQKPGCTVIVSQEKDHQGAVCIECGNTWTNPPYGVLATVKLEPSAYLKEWTDRGDGLLSRRYRVDLDPDTEHWMPADTVVTPLYRGAKP